MIPLVLNKIRDGEQISVARGCVRKGGGCGCKGQHEGPCDGAACILQCWSHELTYVIKLHGARYTYTKKFKQLNTNILIV